MAFYYRPGCIQYRPHPPGIVYKTGRDTYAGKCTSMSPTVDFWCQGRTCQNHLGQISWGPNGICCSMGWRSIGPLWYSGTLEDPLQGCCDAGNGCDQCLAWRNQRRGHLKTYKNHCRKICHQYWKQKRGHYW